jgi:hypothetical protein
VSRKRIMNKIQLERPRRLRGAESHLDIDRGY